jgi:myo-inositol 2-dehydrogenase / D-chiro-inositol 1-dehydrogenase
MADSPIRVGFVGAGTMAATHAESLARDGRAAIVAVLDPAPAAAEAFTRRWGGVAVPSLDDLLGAGVDAVYVLSPNVLHVEPSIRALEAGLHVFCEKPMATSLADAARVLESARSARGVYQIGFNRRCSAVYAAAKKAIDVGVIEPRWGHVKMNRGELQEPAWTGDESVTGGFLYETTIHMLDMLRWMLGEVAQVQGQGARNVYQQIDDFALVLRFRSGVVTTLCSSAHATWLFPYERIELYGPHSMLLTEEADRLTMTTGARATVNVTDVTSLGRLDKAGYADENRRFLDSVLGIRLPDPGAEDAYRAVELVEACYRAAESDTPITLPLTP